MITRARSYRFFNPKRTGPVEARIILVEKISSQNKITNDVFRPAVPYRFGLLTVWHILPPFFRKSTN